MQITFLQFPLLFRSGGKTLVDMVQLNEMQKDLLARPDVVATEDLDFEQYSKSLAPTYGTTMTASGNLQTVLDGQTHQVFYDKGSRVMAQTMRYLKERKEELARWSRTFFTFQSAPMTLIWGIEDPIAVVAMADRVKKERPYTDLYKLQGVAHWPSIEAPDQIGDAIIARLGSV